MDQLLTSLLDYSALGIFAIYLIIQSLHSQKKQDSLFKEFQAELRLLRDKREEEITELRDRYAVVIDDLNSHRDRLINDLERKSKAILNKLDKLESQVERMEIQITELRTVEQFRRMQNGEI
tara:strand:+ start:127 stop:492 length:366 start_codon:yes stop_codon:yes gene_type:complete